MTDTPTLDLETLVLDKGAHDNPTDGACVMEAVAFMAGEEWSDHPQCASPVLGALLRAWNDRLDDEDRQDLKRYILRLVGSAGTDEQEATRAWMASDWVVRIVAPTWLRLTAEKVPEHAAALTAHAEALSSLPELRAGMDVTSIKPALTAAREEGHAARRTAVDRLQKATWAAGAAEATWAAEAAGAAGLKGKSYSELKEFFRARIEEALGESIDASIADGFELLDAMLDAKLRSRANREWEHPGAVGRYELISDIRTLLALLDAAQPAHPEGLDVERLARALGTHKWAWLGSTSVRKAAAAIATEYATPARPEELDVASWKEGFDAGIRLADATARAALRDTP